MKNIIVPVDFSTYSMSAARTAAFLARKTGAQLHLLHVVVGFEDWNKLPVKLQQEDPEMEAKMVDVQIKLEKFSKDSLFKTVNIITHIKGGSPYDQIIAVANAEKADLIVMGAHGSGESNTVFIGSTAQRVMRVAPCPVLSVKNNFKPTAFKKILFPSDFEEDIQDALNKVSSLAGFLKASVALTFINTPGNFNDTETIEKRIQKILPRNNGVKFSECVYNDFTKEAGIANAASKQSADMIAMVTHNRKGKPSYLLGVTEALLFQTEVPVLSITLKSK